MEEDHNTAAIVFRGNVVAHIYVVIFGEKSIPVCLASPKGFLDNNERLNNVCANLIVDD
jgi:hypothetical protein